MTVSATKIVRTLWLVAGIAFAAPSLFFVYYTVRLIYVNLAASPEDAATHRTGGMLIGAIAFPLAAMIFGLISWFCFKRAQISILPA